LNFLARRKAADSRPSTATAGGACALAACAAGSRATVLEMRCGEAEACRLRALGLCEGASVSVVDSRHCMLLEVRGARLALGAALTAGITVLPAQS
jgi:Fe2+ transport system protein FeoA